MDFWEDNLSMMVVAEEVMRVIYNAAGEGFFTFFSGELENQPLAAFYDGKAETRFGLGHFKFFGFLTSTSRNSQCRVTSRDDFLVFV